MIPYRFTEFDDPEPDYELIDIIYDILLEEAERNNRWRRQEERPELEPDLDADLSLF